MNYILIGIAILILFITFTDNNNLKKFILAMLLADIGNYIVLKKAGVVD